MKWLRVLAILLLPVVAQAQSGLTTVTGTVQDSLGNKYANGKWVANLIGITDPSLCFGPGQPAPSDAVGFLDSFGAITTQLTDNSAIQCPNTQWKFNVQSRDGTVAFFCTITITGASMDVTSQMTACAAPLVPAVSVPNINTPMTGNANPVQIDGWWFYGTALGSIPNPATAPSAAVDNVAGGANNNTTRYFVITLLTVTGETLQSPVATLTPSTCGGGACLLSINVAGLEWYNGAIAYRVYACTDATGLTCFRQTGFNDEIDTSGPLANAHSTPGTIILSSVVLAGTAPPLTNTTTIEVDQRAYNSSCFTNTNVCNGTLQYKGNPSSSTAAVTTAIPLLLARAGSRVRGHGSQSIDITSHGSTRSCDFSAYPATTRTKLGCVMGQNVNGVDVDSLNVAATNTNTLYFTTWGSSFNAINWHNSSVSCTGAIAIGCIRMKGIWYGVDFTRNQLFANLSGTGANKGAAVFISNSGGSGWHFGDSDRWTVNAFADAVYNALGKTDRDRNTSATFPTLVGNFDWHQTTVQWAPQVGSPQGQLVRGGGLVLQMDNVKSSDYAVVAGTGPYIELGVDADGALGCCRNAWIRNSVYLQPDTDNASWFKFLGNGGGPAWTALEISNVAATHTNLIDMNNASIGYLEVNNVGIGCNPAATTDKFINMTTTQPLTCIYPANNGVTAQRVANYRFTGGLLFVSDANNNSSNQRHFYWSSNGNFGFFEGDPTVPANEIFTQITGKRTCWRDFNTTRCLLDIDARTGVDTIFVGSNFLPGTTGTRSLGSSALRFTSLFVTSQIDSTLATGTAPFVVASGTKVINLNVDKLDDLDSTNFQLQQAGTSICGTATIAAAGLSVITCTPAAPQTVTAISGGVSGMRFTIICGNTNLTLQNSASLKLSGSVDFVCTANDTITLGYDGTNWFELARTII